jgi:methyl-accepting chemotaxis protein
LVSGKTNFIAAQIRDGPQLKLNKNVNVVKRGNMKLLSNLTIKSRLIVNAVVIAIALSIMFILIVSNSSSLQLLSELSVKSTSLEADVLTLRRNEKDFLARNDLKYVDKFNGNAAKLKSDVNQLSIAFDDYGLDTTSINNFASVSQNYVKKFNELAEYQQ